MLDKSVPYPRILLIGADGQVGWELRRTLAPLWAGSSRRP